LPYNLSYNNKNVPIACKGGDIRDFYKKYEKYVILFCIQFGFLSIWIDSLPFGQKAKN
jgi:hypothetical protein